MYNTKKAQVSSGLVWIIATLIIIFIVVTFVYLSSVISKFKSITIKTNSYKSFNLISVKTSLALLRDSNNKNKIENFINGK